MNTLGTSGNDTYNGVIGATTTLQDVDSIDGGAGIDTLSVIVTTATTSVNNTTVETNASNMVSI